MTLKELLAVKGIKQRDLVLAVKALGAKMDASRVSAMVNDLRPMTPMMVIVLKAALKELGISGKVLKEVEGFNP